MNFKSWFEPGEIVTLSGKVKSRGLWRYSIRDTPVVTGNSVLNWELSARAKRGMRATVVGVWDGRAVEVARFL